MTAKNAPKRKSFNPAAQKQPAFVFDYEAEVEAFYAQFPDYKGKLWFVDMTPTSAAIVRGGQEDISKGEGMLKGFLNFSIRRMQPDRQSFAVRDGMTGPAAIVIDKAGARAGLPRLMGATASDDLEALNTYDHEIGHIVTREGYGRRFGANMGENVGDAFATIRHLQRFGLDADIKAFSEMRAVEFVFRRDRGDHFSTPTVDAILAAAATFDFKKLTPAQTAEAANNFAIAHAPHPALVTYVTRALQPVNNKLPDIVKGDMEPLRELGQLLLETDNANVFKWGRTALTAVIEGRVLVDGVLIQPKGAEWAALQQKLDAREQQHGQGLLFLPPVNPVAADGRYPPIPPPKNTNPLPPAPK
jgi:hypothetical protein